jgi:hypothetical protein
MAAKIRTTVSIPPELKARMDKAGESVNWSEVAAQAFEQKLAEILKRKGTMTMNEGLERLRASKRKFGVTEFWKGHKAGENWAVRSADASELANIAEWKESFQVGEWEREWKDDVYSPMRAETFACKVDPENIISRNDAESWWDQIGYRKMPSAEFVHGFADGAVDVWEKV